MLISRYMNVSMYLGVVEMSSWHTHVLSTWIAYVYVGTNLSRSEKWGLHRYPECISNSFVVKSLKEGRDAASSYVR